MHFHWTLAAVAMSGSGDTEAVWWQLSLLRTQGFPGKIAAELEGFLTFYPQTDLIRTLKSLGDKHEVSFMEYLPPAGLCHPALFQAALPLPTAEQWLTFPSPQLSKKLHLSSVSPFQASTSYPRGQSFPSTFMTQGDIYQEFGWGLETETQSAPTYASILLSTLVLG